MSAYRVAGREDKNVILSEFCANTGYHRKYAIRLLNGPRPEKRRKVRERRRGVSYGPEMLAILTAVWGSGRLSVVGAIESAVAGVDAVDTQTLSNASGDREAG